MNMREHHRAANVEPELYLTLARAFTAPVPGTSATAFRTLLADDLGELGTELGLGVERSIASFRAGVSRYTDDAQLLVDYSRLFLSPPVPAHLNLGHYYARARVAYGMQALLELMKAHALRLDETFRDQPDHLVALIEMMALHRARPSDEALRATVARYFLCPVLPALRADLVRADPASPWVSLLDILWEALAGHRDVGDGESASTTAMPEDRQQCAVCGRDYVSVADLRVIAASLSAAGMPTAHLTICPDCRGIDGHLLPTSHT